MGLTGGKDQRAEAANRDGGEGLPAFRFDDGNSDDHRSQNYAEDQQVEFKDSEIILKSCEPPRCPVKFYPVEQFDDAQSR